MSFLRHVDRCNARDPALYLPLTGGATVFGFVGTALARRLADFPRIIEAASSGLRLAPSLDSVAARTAAIQELGAQLADSGDIRPLEGEAYAAVSAWGQAAAFTVDRALVPPLGLKAFGIHVNGVVDDGADPQDMRMWIGRRAQDRRVAPGKLDNLIAGGQPYGLTLEQNLAKEAAEEAGLDAPTASRARPVGALTYTMAQPDGLRRDTLFVYDLRVPDGIRPQNQDGEVDAFDCLPIADIAARVRETDDFKFNVALVIIDFLIRHGLVTPDEPDYLALVRGLHG